MLNVKSVHTYYGSIHALKGVSLHVRPGETVALIGANGAGKSTLVSTICGLVKSQRGTVEFQGKAINAMSAEDIVREGVGLVPEGRQIFSTLTVEANLQMGGFIHRRNGGQVAEDMERMYESFPILRQRSHQLAGTLSGGEQQMLAISRALMSRPKLLVLDEPTMGLAPLIIKEIFNIIRELRT
ncbi:MAG: ABC transporter ATP-binding protein, partial [Desulforhabdus sp.]|nr:ABC transporter ATP-binding protein [Desulforhabdus sp.]